MPLQDANPPFSPPSHAIVISKAPLSPPTPNGIDSSSNDTFWLAAVKKYFVILLPVGRR